MNIGIDIDDTIVNTYERLLQLICMKYDINFNELISKKLPYKEIYNILPNFDTIRKDLFPIMAKCVHLKENVKEVLTKLKCDGHKIIFITARDFDDYSNPYDITINYLERNDIPYDKLFINVKNKGEKCIEEEIDLFIDDNMGNCRDVMDVGVKTYQFDAIFTSNVEGATRVYSWNEIYDLINS